MSISQDGYSKIDAFRLTATSDTKACAVLHSGILHTSKVLEPNFCPFVHWYLQVKMAYRLAPAPSTSSHSRTVRANFECEECHPGWRSLCSREIYTETVPRCGFGLQAAEAQRAHGCRSKRGGVFRVPEHTERAITADIRLSICLEFLGGQKACAQYAR